MKKTLISIFSLLLIISLTSCSFPFFNMGDKTETPEVTLTPEVTPNPTPSLYSLTFITEYGDEPKIINDLEKIPTDLPVLTEDGWIFEGWYYDLTYNNKVFAYDKLEKNTIIYAKWTKQTYNIMFSNNGHGETVNTIKNLTKVPTSLPILKENGWTFEGWFYDQKFTKPVKANDELTMNTMLYAKWSEVSYNVTYYINNRGEQPDNLSKVNKLPDQLPLLNDPNYNFIGWYYDTAFTNEANPNDLLTKDTTLYAKWEKKTYTISFNINELGEQPESLTNVNKIPYSLPRLTENYYSFDGWYMDDKFTTPVESGSTITSNITLHAKWTKIAFIISFIDEKFEITSEKIENVSKLPYSLPILNYEGYQFVGWYMDPELTIKAISGSNITEDLTLYAKWEIIPEPEPTYSIMFIINGHGSQPTNLLEQSNLPNPLPDLSEEGFNFLGWFLDEEFIYEAYPGAFITEDTILYAKWEELFNITYNTNGHGNLNNIVDVTSIPTELPELSTEGFNFLGWYLDEDFTTPAIPGSSIDSDTTLYAKWQELYNVSYVTNGHGSINDLNNVLNLPSPLPTLNVDGYNFLGWFLDEGLINPAIEGTKLDSNVTLYAKWQELYDLTFNNNGHGQNLSKIENISYLPDKLSELTEEGYNFLGWYLDEDFNNPAISGYELTNDTTLYAKWELITYSISFNVNGHGIQPSTLFKVISIPNTLPELSEEGWNFKGWYINPELTDIALPNTTISKDTVLYAKWEIITYTVSFNNNDYGYTPNSLTGITRLPDILPILAEQGYRFDGWYYDSLLTDKANPNDLIDSDITLYAKWTQIVSKPTYTKFVSGGTTDEGYTINVTNGLGTEQTFKYNGCTGFYGVYTNISGYNSMYSTIEITFSNNQPFKICLETYVDGTRKSTKHTPFEIGNYQTLTVDLTQLITGPNFKIFLYLDATETVEVEKTIVMHSFKFIDPNNPNGEDDLSPEPTYDSNTQTYIVNYAESNESFLNPDRGFYNAKVYTGTTTSAGEINSEELYSNNLLHLRFDIGAFSTAATGTDMPLTDEYLESLRSMMQAIDNAGACAIVRFAYTYPSDVPEGTSLSVIANKEPSIDMMKTHIRQFVEILNDYHQVITALECGLVGPWGEMHSSEIATQETWNILFDQYLEVLDNRIKFLVRQPNFIYKYYGYTLDNLDTFNYEKYNRIGCFNDGYLGSDTDLGTFDDREKEITFLEKLESFPYGGEVVKDSTPNDYNQLWFSCNEMFRTNLSYLNIAWNDEVIERWQNTAYNLEDPLYNGKSEFDYINNHLGYRFVCEQLQYKLNESFEYSLKIKNVGFGGLYKGKTAYIILKNGNSIYKYECGYYDSILDDSITITGKIKLNDLASGDYNVYFVFADDFSTTSVRGIRFANYYMYDEILQANKITKITI